MLKGKYNIRYTIEGKKGEINVEVELKTIDGLLKGNQNVYEATAKLNDTKFKHPDLRFCVNAKHMAEAIALEQVNILRKKHGKKLRVKKK